tara:strand:+ start:55 stop:501 length:447 start_codon:yes stop_codon:yes gene_type:complete
MSTNITDTAVLNLVRSGNIDQTTKTRIKKQENDLIQEAIEAREDREFYENLLSMGAVPASLARATRGRSRRRVAQATEDSPQEAFTEIGNDLRKRIQKRGIASKPPEFTTGKPKEFESPQVALVKRSQEIIRALEQEGAIKIEESANA